jgi:predicted Zn-dependent peptidase
MRDFHDYWYQPTSITAAVVGNLPVDELIETVARGFTANQSGFAELKTLESESLSPESPFREIVRQECTDETLQQARLIMLWRVPGIMELEETYALDILGVILGQGKVSRLYRDLREERALVRNIGVSNLTQTYQGIFYISAQLPVENLDEVEKAIAEHIERLQTELIPAKDIARIRTQVANRFIFANERPSDRANLYGYYYSQLQDLAPALNYPQHIQAVEASDLQAAAEKYLDPHAYGIVVMKPTSSRE